MIRFVPSEVQRLLDNLEASAVEVKQKTLKINGVSHNVLLVRVDTHVVCYKYEPTTKSWHKKWNEDNVFAATDDVMYTPWFISEDGFLIVRNAKGIHIYKLDEQLKIKFVASDGRYHDVYKWNTRNHVLLFGNFYSDPAKIGIISRNERGDVSFEAVIKEQAVRHSQQPIWRMDTDPGIADYWKDLNTDISLAYVDSGDQQAIIVRTSEKLGLYKFGSNHVMKTIQETSKIPYSNESGDRVIFGRILSGTKQMYDILHLNSTGIAGYTYDTRGREYSTIFTAPQFIREQGWSVENLKSFTLHDVDGDGIDELFYNAPSGLNAVRFSAERNAYDRILHDANLNVTDRHSKSLVINEFQNTAMLISVSETSLISFELKAGKEDSHDIINNQNSEIVHSRDPIPLQQQSQTMLSVVALHDKLDFKSFLYPRNPLLGILDFSVPLIEVPNHFGIPISRSIQYKEYAPSDILGSGWSLSIDCIYIERKGSIFSIDHDYYLVKDGARSQLKPNYKKQSFDFISFSLDGSPSVDIKFYKTQNKWILSTPHEQYTYGNLNNVDWVQWEAGSEEWPIFQNTESQTKAKPSAWFLAIREDKHGHSLKYIYKPIYSKLSSDQMYIERLNLLKISSDNGDSVRFTYVESHNTTLLSEFVAQTSYYTQKINFEYTLLKSLPRLTSITQLGIPILEFSYEGSKGELSKIIYPNGLTSTFSYSSLAFHDASVENSFHSFSDMQLAYGNDYILIGGKTEVGQVRIQARDVVGSETTQMSGLTFPALGKENVIHFEILTADFFFAVVLSHENHKELCLFKQKSEGWSSEASYMKLDKDSVLMIGKSFILIRNKQKLAALQQVADKWEVKPISNNLPNNAIVQGFSYAYVIQNNSDFSIGFQRDDGTWITKSISFADTLIDSSLRIFDEFEMDKDTLDKLKGYFKEGVLHTHHNAIVIRTIGLQDSKLYLNLHFRIFNEKYDMINQETVSVLVEDLETYRLELPAVQNNVFKIGYERVDGTYKVKVKEHTGAIIDEIKRLKENIEEEIRKHPHASEAEKAKYRRESHDKLNDELQQIYKNVTANIPFAIDPAKFGVFVNNENVISASHKFVFNGNRWNYQKVPDNEINVSNIEVKLGNSYVLAKPGKNDTFKLFKTGKNRKMMWDLQTASGNDIILSYPAFVGVQKANSTGEVFTFGNNKIHRFAATESISRMSNNLAIITTAQNMSTVTIKPLKSLLNHHQNVITRQEIIHNDDEVQVTTFEYDASKVKPYSDGFSFTKSKILPGGNQQIYGWYEEHYDLKNATNSSKTVHNSKGHVVKIIATESDAERMKPNNDDDGILMDVMKRSIISDFRPYKISQEVVSYYGFEPHEQNRIGANSKWNFNNSFIVQESSTHFLRLPSNASIKGTFAPKLENVSFVISCWLRSSQKSQIANSLIVKALSRNGKLIKQVEGSIVQRIGDWNYVEVICKSTQSESLFKIEVQIINPTGAVLDVDHVRFTPLDLNFHANIFDNRSGRILAVLKNTGLLQQTLLDRFGNEAAHVSESGAVTFFTTKSKNSSILRNSKWISKVEMEPMFGELMRTALNGNSRFTESLKYPSNVVSFRFLYKIENNGSALMNVSGITVRIERNGNQTSLKINNLNSLLIDMQGEILILLTKSFISIWAEGHLLTENRVNSSNSQARPVIEVVCKGQITLGEIMILYEPSVRLYYLDKLGLAVQETVLQNHNSVKIRQIVYDKINRPVLKTKWTHITSTKDVLLSYNADFLTNLNNILSTRKVKGQVNELNTDCEGYPYTWLSYQDDPLEVKKSSGLPGKPFSIDGPYSSKFGSNPSIATLKTLFPPEQGYKHEFELNSGGSLAVSIYDEYKNKVAELVKVVNHDHRLTTFEYDDKQRLIRELPPMYHYKTKTLSKIDAFNAHNVSPEERILRDKWAKQFKYDAKGQLIEKSSPDSGRQEFLYTEQGLLRFIVNIDSENSTNDTIFYTYNSLGGIIEKGMLNVPPNELHQYLDNSSSIPKSQNFILFDRGENELVPAHRHRVQKSRKTVDNISVTEALIFDDKDRLLNKIFLSANNSMAINYEYMNGKVTGVIYPFFIGEKQLKLSYDYNAYKKISSVRTGNHVLATMTHTPHEHINEIHFEPTSHFTYKRQFSYNAPGYLTTVKDKFLTESIEYISGSYGGQSFGDGTISATQFNATWHVFSDVEFIKLKPQDFLSDDTTSEQANLCFNTLKKLGFLDNLNRPLKSLYPATELRLPLVCGTGSRANHISAIMASKGYPMYYGHRYDYENHKQLIKAKYFQNADEFSLEPLTQDTFSKNIRGISASESKQIWNSLKAAGFIITDCTNSKICHALQGKSLFHSAIKSHINTASLQILFAGAIKVKKDLPENVFMSVCKTWHEHDPLNYDQLCKAIWKELLEKNFVGSRSSKSTNTLNPELKEALKPHSKYQSEIVSVLYENFAKALGYSDGDIQSYDIDANGNHMHYYTGFKRYRMEYHENTNKISKVFCTDLTTEAMKEKEFVMEHDSRGSVTKAMHKNISKIIYDPLINRVKQVNLLDGRKVFFQYDIRGERVLKLVANKNGKIIKEKYYVRDLKGKCLVEYDVTHLKTGESPLVRSTAYIYSENTMLGFIRGEQFYSVYSDHEGSIRLVIRNGEVVAAYDYMPYGQLLREYNIDPDASIVYRYTGQEWDEETNLYNYHARLYDPEIGRFYQIDPKEQYPSPYVYAGNSPISLVDPDGQFAFLAIVAFAAVGGYLGAASANNSFNPLKWKLKPTLIGGGLGALLGGLAPPAIGASFAFLTVTAGMTTVGAIGLIGTTAVGFAYLSGASANQNWNPLEWNWSSPATFNALFGGAISGATLFAGIGNVHAKYMALSGMQRIVFVGLATTSTLGVAGFAGAMANNGSLNVFEWNWSSPDTIWKVTMGASFGIQMATKLQDMEKLIEGKIRDFGSLIKTAKTGDMKLFWSDAKTYFKDTRELVNSILDIKKNEARILLRQPFLQLVGASSKKSEGTINTIKSILFEVAKTGIAQDEINELIQHIEDVQFQNKEEHSVMKRNIDYQPMLALSYSNPTNQSNMLTSGASTYASMLGTIFDDICSQIKFFFDIPTRNESVVSDMSFPKLRKLFKTFNLQNCYQFELADNSVMTKCFNWNYQCTIYPKISSKHFSTEDSFSHCTPIEFEGKPSVACDGENTSTIFTINPSINVLDHVNGTLMLTLIAPAAFESAKQFLRFCCSIFSNNCVDVVTPKVDNIKFLMTKLAILNGKVTGFQAQTTENIDWVEHILEDLKEDILQYTKDELNNDLYHLTERLEAVEEELNELIYLNIESYNKYTYVTPQSNISENNISASLLHFGSISKLPCINQYSPSYLT